MPKVIRLFMVVALLTIFYLFSAKPAMASDPLANEFASLPCTPTTNANLTATGGSSGLALSIGTNSVMAGAITSLTINGMETVNSSDHGREIQYAFQIGSGGEGNNPTEAGGSSGITSKFLEGCASGNTIYTKSQMAYWFPYNGQTLSPYVLSKIVQVGSHGIPNLIRFVARIHAPVASDALSIESPTGYHTTAFDYQLSLFDIATKTIRVPPDSEFQHNLWNVFNRAYSAPPSKLIIVSNGQYSLIPYMPTSVSGYFYGHAGVCPEEGRCDKSGWTSKWSMGTRVDNPQPSDYYIESYLLVSPNTNILSDINSLLNLAPQSTNPIGSLDGATCSVINGWAGDKDSPNTSIDVHFYANGAAGAGGTFVGSTTANSTREKAVCDALGSTQNPCPHGFSFSVPSSLKDGQPHTIYAYGINAPGSGGTNALLFNTPKSITCSSTTPSPSPTPTPTPTTKPGDLNADGKVDIYDYNLIVSNFGKTGSNLVGDIDKNGKVDIYDYNLLVASFGK